MDKEQHLHILATPVISSRAKRLLRSRGAKVIHSRILEPKDAAIVRALRLEALEPPHPFAASREEEMKLPLVHWENVLAPNRDHAYFGSFTFADSQPVALAYVTKFSDYSLAFQDRATNQEDAVLFGSAYVRQSFRELGVWSALHKLRTQWSIDNGFSEAFAFVRNGNKSAFRALSCVGAKMCSVVSGRYPDDRSATSYLFRDDLRTAHRDLAFFSSSGKSFKLNIYTVSFN